jgi:PGF-CTERM protein
MNLPIMVEKLLEVIRMPHSPNKLMVLLLSSITVLLILSAFITPTSASTIIQLQPTTVSSGDRVLVSADVARKGSTVTLYYYYDKSGTGVAPAGASWIKIADVTDGGPNDSKNVSNGYIDYSWMTPQLSPGQYIIKVVDPNGPNRTTELTVANAPLNIVPTIYGAAGTSAEGLVNTGSAFSVIALVTGNCRLCHETNNPTAQNPGVNLASVESLFTANLSQINPTETSVQPNMVNHTSGTEAYVAWTGIASKTLASNQTLSVTVTGTNPAGNLTTQATAYAGVNKAVNIAPTSTNNQAATQSSATTQPSSSSGNPLPGFEIPVALAGLVVVAYLLSRKR